MKKLIFAFLLLSASLAMRLESQEKHELGQKHEAALTAATAVSAASSVSNAAVALGKFFSSLFDVTCSKYGYKRSNNINIFNDMSSGTMTFRG